MDFSLLVNAFDNDFHLALGVILFTYKRVVNKKEELLIKRLR
jgi:hypothetical protein